MSGAVKDSVARESARPITISNSSFLLLRSFSRTTSRSRPSLESRQIASRFSLSLISVSLMDTYDSLLEPYVMSDILVASHVSLRWAVPREYAIPGKFTSRSVYCLKYSEPVEDSTRRFLDRVRVVTDERSARMIILPMR